jgi:Regulator of ribonuclease activity B
VISGFFRLSFPTQAAMKVAARDCRAKAFAVEMSEGSDAWHVLARRRGVFPESECDRYAGRLKLIATEHEGTYDGFRPDDPPAEPNSPRG